jgi:hypothetical protein
VKVALDEGLAKMVTPNLEMGFVIREKISELHVSDKPETVVFALTVE